MYFRSTYYKKSLQKKKNNFIVVNLQASLNQMININMTNNGINRIVYYLMGWSTRNIASHLWYSYPSPPKNYWNFIWRKNQTTPNGRTGILQSVSHESQIKAKSCSKLKMIKEIMATKYNRKGHYWDNWQSLNRDFELHENNESVNFFLFCWLFCGFMEGRGGIFTILESCKFEIISK